MNFIKRWLYRNWKIMPLDGYPRWDAKKHMERCGARDGKCLFCGNIVPLYPIGGGTIVHADGIHADIYPFNGRCIACGRNPYDHGISLYEEYADGCTHVVYVDDSRGEYWYGSEKSRHAPHNAFKDDKPILVLQNIS